jgi:hypothetical protein
MLGPSLKSVPGCFVSIVPMLIGVPVALTPGFDPQDEVLVLAGVVLGLLLVVAGVLPVLLAAGDVLLLLEPPQPASASAPTITTSAAISGTRKSC